MYGLALKAKKIPVNVDNDMTSAINRLTELRMLKNLQEQLYIPNKYRKPTLTRVAVNK